MKRSTILVVEDNDDNALICCTALEHFGFDTVRAADGGAGLRLARELSPDLIILDLSLPGMSGWEVAERLRAEESATRAIPIVVWSANDSPSDRATAKRLGCVSYLVKPCPIRPMLNEVERVLREAGAEAAESGGAATTRPRVARLVGVALAAVLSLAAVSLRLRRRANRRRGVMASVPLLGVAGGAA